MDEKQVDCSLWFPDQGPISVVHICYIDWGEWESYVKWDSPPYLNHEDRIIRIGHDAVKELINHIDAADWDAAPEPAMLCMAILSQFLKQADEQDA